MLLMYPGLESLESRRLLSASVYFMASNGKLFVNGGAGDDAITVTLRKLSVQPFGDIEVKDGDAIVEKRSLEGVKAVYVYPKAGNDTVGVFSDEVGRLPVLISTADGNDTVTSSSWLSHGHAIYSGDGSDTIDVTVAGGELGAYVNAGAGDDVVTTQNAYSARGATVVGGAGNDHVAFTSNEASYADKGNSGYGGEGNDTLIGSEMDDYLCGNDGADSLVGNGGVDFLRGGEGNDHLLTAGDNTADRVELGGGDDESDADEFDQVM